MVCDLCGACAVATGSHHLEVTDTKASDSFFFEMVTRLRLTKTFYFFGNLQEQWWKNHLVADKIPGV